MLLWVGGNRCGEAAEAASFSASTVVAVGLAGVERRP